MKTGFWKTVWETVLWLGLLLILYVLAAAALGPQKHWVLWEVLTGWWRFLGRNWPQVTVNWTLIATGLACSVALLFLAHRLFAWLYRQARGGREGAPASGWRWGWSLSIYGGVWLLFAIVFGASGIYRHTNWLWRYPESWHQVRSHPMADLKEAVVNTMMLIQDHSEKADLCRKAFLASTNWPGRKPGWEKYNVIFYEDKTGKVAAFVIAPRQWPDQKSPAQFAVSTPQNSLAYVALSNLSSCLEGLEKQYGRGK